MVQLNVFLSPFFSIKLKKKELKKKKQQLKIKKKKQNWQKKNC